MNDLRFQKSRKSKLQGRLIMLCLLVLSALILQLGINSQSVLLLTMCGGSFLLAVYFLIKSFRDVDTVIVNPSGISSKVNGMGLIEWKYIDGFEIKEAVNTTCLVLNLNNKNEFLKTKNKAVQSLMKSNIDRLGSPVVLPENLFNESLEAVKEKIEGYHRRL